MTSKPLTPLTLLIQLFMAVTVLAVAAFVCSLIGTQDISLADAIDQALHHPEGTDAQIYFGIRLNRIAFAAAVGMALSCSGVILQGLLRNPLADPYILGISSGAGLGAIVAVVTGLSITALPFTPMGLMAFVFALGTVWFVWLVGKLTGNARSTHLLLAGVVVNAFFSAMIMFITSIARADQVYSTLFWLMGNIKPESPRLLGITWALVLAAMLTLFSLAPALNAVSFERAHARTLGIHVGRTQLFAFAVAAFVTALAVALSGLIGFVGLIVPHSVRLIYGPDHRRLIPLSGLYGAAFLVVSDTLSRTIVAPAQLPVGVITAIIGAPFFLILLIRYSRKVSMLSK